MAAIAPVDNTGITTREALLKEEKDRLELMKKTVKEVTYPVFLGRGRATVGVPIVAAIQTRLVTFEELRLQNDYKKYVAQIKAIIALEEWIRTEEEKLKGGSNARRIYR